VSTTIVTEYSAPSTVVPTTSEIRKVTVYQNEQSDTQYIEAPNRIVTVIERGIQGIRGPIGDITGQLLTPFYQVSSLVWETSHSIAFTNTISSSLTPYSSSVFSLGTTNLPWKKLNVGVDGVSFISPTGSILSTIYGVNGGVQVSGSLIITHDDPLTNSLEVYSGSTLIAKINGEGLLVLHSFDTLPTVELGAFVYSGSNLYIGAV